MEGQRLGIASLVISLAKKLLEVAFSYYVFVPVLVVFILYNINWILHYQELVNFQKTLDMETRSWYLVVSSVGCALVFLYLIYWMAFFFTDQPDFNFKHPQASERVREKVSRFLAATIFAG